MGRRVPRPCIAIGSASALPRNGSESNALLEPYKPPAGGYRRGTINGRYRIFTTAAARRLCASEAATDLVLPQQLNTAVSCSTDDAVTLADHGVQLFIGVLSAPRNRVGRDAVRQTWMKWPAVGQSVLVCFVIGRLHVPPQTLKAVDAEANRRRDVLWLNGTSDGCYLTISKVYDFWRAAAARLHPRGVRHVVKVDEDSFVHLPNLQAKLLRLSCVEHLYFGGGAHAGYHPHLYTMCGFSWRGDSSFTRYGCANRGAHPPFPFVMGGLQALSSSTVQHLATSRFVAEFVARSDVAVNYTRLAASHGLLTVNDDVILGFWLSDAQMQRRISNITYVFANELMTNLECDLRDCMRKRHCSMYRLPSNDSILIHNLKAVSMMVYVYAVIRGWSGQDSTACKRFRGTSHLGLKPAQKWLAGLGLPRQVTKPPASL